MEKEPQKKQTLIFYSLLVIREQEVEHIDVDMLHKLFYDRYIPGQIFINFLLTRDRNGCILILTHERMLI